MNKRREDWIAECFALISTATACLHDASRGLFDISVEEQQTAASFEGARLYEVLQNAQTLQLLSEEVERLTTKLEDLKWH